MKQIFLVVALAIMIGPAAEAAIPRQALAGSNLGTLSPEDSAELARLQEDLAIALGNQGSSEASERIRLAQCFGWRNCPPAGTYYGTHPGFGPAPVYRPPGVVVVPGVPVVPVVPVVPFVPVVPLVPSASNICVRSDGYGEAIPVYLARGSACHVNYPDGSLKFNGYIQ